MPAFLQVTHNFPRLKPASGEVISLEVSDLCIGRRAECAVVLNHDVVSRRHAHIVYEDGNYYLEDLNSYNHTYLNDVELKSYRRTLLRHKDRIRIGEFHAIFQDPDETADSDPEAALSSHSGSRLESQSAEKLRALLDFHSTLTKTHEVDQLLAIIAEGLFRLFKQADRCFLIQAGTPAQPSDPIPLQSRLVRTRDPRMQMRAQYSRTIARRCLESAEARLYVDPQPTDGSIYSEGLRSVMCAPLLGPRGYPFGVIQIDTHNAIHRFQAEDLELLTAVATQSATMLENIRLQEVSRIQKDLEFARTVQNSFLPRTAPEIPTYQFAKYYQPAYSVGGDYYSFLPFKDGQCLMAVGDVAGKGVSAALLMAKISSEMVASALVDHDPARIVDRLNVQMTPFTSPLQLFVTLAVALLDPREHGLQMVSAGHLPPLIYNPLRDKLRPAMTYADSGYPIGLEECNTYQAVSVTLAPGEILLLFSDGLPDATSPASEQFRIRGIEAAIHAMRPRTAEHLVEALVEAVSRHVNGGSPHDDITVLAVQRSLTPSLDDTI